MPSDNGVTSSKTRSWQPSGAKSWPPPVKPALRMAPCTAAPTATASSTKKAQLDDLLEWLEYDAEDADMDALAERVATLKADFGVVVK